MRPDNVPISRVTHPLLCTGCSACVFVCPVNAVSMLPCTEGFLRPVINSERCVGCGKCAKYCPENGLRIGFGSAPFFSTAAYVDDMDLRMSCSSGGIFSRLAEVFLSKGGTVCGAAFAEGEVGHVFVSEVEKLPVLRTSKYVQSKMADTHLRAGEILSNGGRLLFSGTPCQVASLRSFLDFRNLDVSGLFCVDLICHGVPSPGVFGKYMAENGWSGADVVNFRCKDSGWKNPILKISEGGKTLHCKPLGRDLYGGAFLANITLRLSCYHCRYASMRRFGDLTLGDMWNIDEVAPPPRRKWGSRAGVSVVLVNTLKGIELMRSVENSVNSFEVSNDVAARSNGLLHNPVFEPVGRRRFFTEFVRGRKRINTLLLKYSYSAKGSLRRKICKVLALGRSFLSPVLGRKLFDDASDPSRRVAVLNMSSSNCSFGALLVAYSLQSVLIKLGYLPSIVNYNPDLRNFKRYFRRLISGLNMVKFRHRFLNSTRTYVSCAGLKNLNKRFKIFIFGSDQIWRYSKKDYPAYFGAFVGSDARLVSYAASFGKEKWDDAPDADTARIKKLINRFSSVSVREDSGVGICSEIFGKDSVCVLDPTLLLDRYDYAGICEMSKVDVSGNYVSCAFLSSNADSPLPASDAGNLASEYFGAPSRNILYRKISILGVKKPFLNGVPEWMSLIANSRFVLTNSFHCMVFSIIFGREFACLDMPENGNTRGLSLLSRLGIGDRFVRNRTELESAFASKINYGEVYAKLDALKRDSVAFLKRSLSDASRK